MVDGGARSGDADDEGALGGLDDVVGDRMQLVDLQDAFDLGKESLEETEVPAGDARDRCDRLGVGEVVWVECLAEGPPVPLQDEEHLVVAQGRYWWAKPTRL